MDKLEFILALHNNSYYQNQFNTTSVKADLEEGDVCSSYYTIEYRSVPDLFVIKRKQNIVKEKYGYRHWSLTTKIVGEEKLNFTQLKESDYWMFVNKHFHHGNIEKIVERYNSCEAIEGEEWLEVKLFDSRGNYMGIDFNKFSGDLKVDVQYNQPPYMHSRHSDRINSIVVTDKDAMQDLQKGYDNSVMLDHLSQQGCNITVLENGYVIDNKYYEELSHYKEEDAE